MKIDVQRRLDLSKIYSAWNAQDRFTRIPFQADIRSGVSYIHHPQLSEPIVTAQWELDEYIKEGILDRVEPQHTVEQNHRIERFTPSDRLESTLKVEFFDNRTQLTLEEEQLLAKLNFAWSMHQQPFVQRQRGGNRLFDVFHPGLPGGETYIPHRTVWKLFTDEYLISETFERPEWRRLINITSKGREWFENIGERRYMMRSKLEPDETWCETTKPQFFLVFGHDENFAREVRNFFQNTLHLPLPIMLNREGSGGRLLWQKFEDEAAKADGALVLLTADDVLVEGDANQSWHARQNVILELGYFLGKFPRDGRVLVILKHGANLVLPSDLLGIHRVGVSGSIESVSEKIRLELEKTFEHIDFKKTNVELNRSGGCVEK